MAGCSCQSHFSGRRRWTLLMVTSGGCYEWWSMKCYYFIGLLVNKFERRLGQMAYAASRRTVHDLSMDQDLARAARHGIQVRTKSRSWYCSIAFRFHLVNTIAPGVWDDHYGWRKLPGRCKTRDVIAYSRGSLGNGMLEVNTHVSRDETRSAIVNTSLEREAVQGVEFGCFLRSGSADDVREAATVMTVSKGRRGWRH